MTELEEHTDDVDRDGAETTFRFILTMIVATLIVAVSGFVLSVAVLSPEKTARGTAPTHTERS